MNDRLEGNDAGSGGSIIEQYRSAYAVHGDSPLSVLWPRGRQHLRFDALTQHFLEDGFSVLDYGCGLAHLKPFLDQRFQRYEYRGADMVPEFVAAVAAKYPQAKMALVKGAEDIIDPVDHVVISGTFNIVDGDSEEAYLDMVERALEHLFSLCRVSLSVNFMTDRVDFMQPRAHHVNVERMYRFFCARLSPRLMLNQSYMPYEFTMTALRDASIVRPDNIYKSA